MQHVMTRQQFRTAIARGLRAAPQIPSDVRYAITEYGANADHFGTNFTTYDQSGDRECHCPLAAVGYVNPDEPTPLPPGADAFIDAFDAEWLHIVAPNGWWTGGPVVEVTG